MVNAESVKTLQVENLTTAYLVNGTWVNVLRNISLMIDSGHSYGLVGESGSGKTTLALSIFDYLGKNARVQQGRVLINGRDIYGMDETNKRGLWGSQICLVPQHPLTALNPSLKVGDQIAEIYRYKFGLHRSLAAKRVYQEFERVHLPDPERVFHCYPHQLSGGMLQRILIGMAMSIRPSLLVLDEPTTNLDVTTQAGILELIAELIQEAHSSVLYVSHNLGVIAQICDRVAVLYAGEIIEDGSVDDIFSRSVHPYTRALLACLPGFETANNKKRLAEIQGSVPSFSKLPTGCSFSPRCPLASKKCQESPPIVQIEEEHLVRCHHWQEIINGDVEVMFTENLVGREKSSIYDTPDLATEGFITSNFIKLSNVEVGFPLGRSSAEVMKRKPTRRLTAVEDVSLALSRGMTLGLVGESGSGKTTLGRAIVGLVERTAGEIELDQIVLPLGLAGRSIETLRRLQMVFQNPDEALNPYRTIGAALRQSIMTLQGRSRNQAEIEVQRLLALVRLPDHVRERFPDELSGGEKQRAAIARALALDPELLIADEPVSSLDISVQAAIINLLQDLKIQTGTTILFISHDLAITCYLADWVAVIYLGQLMQISRAQDFYQPPYHPYTEALLSAIPVPDSTKKMDRIRLEGEIPSAIHRPSGCPFHPRCPRRIGEICSELAPVWQTGQNNSRIYCHIPVEELLKNQNSYGLSSDPNRFSPGQG